MSKDTLMDLISSLRDEMEGFIAHVDGVFLSTFSESSLGEEILLYDKAVEWEKEEAEPLKKAYLRAVQKVFRFIPSGELPRGSVYGEFVKALSGMEEEKYEKLVERRILMLMDRWERGEIVGQEGEEGLRVMDEVLETARYLVDLGIFSKYVEILEMRRQLDEVKEFCKVSEKPLGVEERIVLVGELMDENGLEIEAGMLETKYGVFLECANWFDVVMEVWEKQKDAEEPLLVSALYIYLKPIIKKAEFVKDYLERMYRRQLKRYGESPFLNACGVSLMKLGFDVKVDGPRSRSAEVIWSW
jgi:hypothetical protein